MSFIREQCESHPLWMHFVKWWREGREDQPELRIHDDLWMQHVYPLWQAYLQGAAAVILFPSDEAERMVKEAIKKCTEQK